MDNGAWTAQVKLFAGAREAQGAGVACLRLEDGPVRAGEFLERFFKCHPKLSGLGGRLAVNLEFAEDRTPIRDGDELALIPPVSGG